MFKNMPKTAKMYKQHTHKRVQKSVEHKGHLQRLTYSKNTIGMFLKTITRKLVQTPTLSDRTRNNDQERDQKYKGTGTKDRHELWSRIKTGIKTGIKNVTSFGTRTGTRSSTGTGSGNRTRTGTKNVTQGQGPRSGQWQRPRMGQGKGLEINKESMENFLGNLFETASFSLHFWYIPRTPIFMNISPFNRMDTICIFTIFG